MRRGTTPTHIFTTDISLSDAEAVFLTYQQGGETVLEIEKGERMTLTDSDLTVTLTQAESLLFDARKRVQMQIRARFADGSAIASDIIETSAQSILKEGEI